MTPENKTPHEGETSEQPHWIEKPKNVNLIVWALYAVCALLIGIDVWIHKHGPFAIEYYWGFYGIYGLSVASFWSWRPRECGSS